MQSLLFLSLLCCSAIQARTDYTTLVTFGDSKSDTGNAYRLSNGTWPPVPPFNRNGGFAAALLWSQILVGQLFTNATLEDFSCASATTDSWLVQGSMSRNPNLVNNYSVRNRTQAPGVRQQMVQYITSKINQTIDFDRTLYTMWVGMNNYIFNTSLTPSDTIQSILDCLNLLIIFGARHVMVFNESPYDRFPEFRNTTMINVTKALYWKHNEILAKKMNESYLSSNTRLNIRLFDSYGAISRILNNYASYEFENLDSCWDTKSQATVIVRCGDITLRVFADEYHLTSAAQALFAKELYSDLIGWNSTSSAILETSTNFNLVLLIISIGYLIK